VHVERFHMPDPTPDNHVETRFEADASGGTRMIMTMTVDNAETMEAMIATGMTEGMEASYRRLETLGEMAPRSCRFRWTCRHLQRASRFTARSSGFARSHARSTVLP